MNKCATFAVAVVAATSASLGACANQQSSQPNTSPLTSAPPGAEKMTTELKSPDGTSVATATFEFADGYATVTVEARPNQVLSPGFHGLQVHSAGKCEGGDFNSAGDVYQAPNHTGYPASGELTALQVRPNGAAKLVTTTASFSAADLRNGSGTALVIHQDPDNLGTNATGESGKRVACGVIAAAAATTTSSTTETPSVTTITTTAVVPPPSTSTSTVTVTSAPTVTSSPTKTVPTNSLPPGS